MALGKTSVNANHLHDYQVDEHGNGWTAFTAHPESPNVKHRHKIEDFVVQESQSECYPNCEAVYGVVGAPPHGHELTDESLPLDSRVDKIYGRPKKTLEILLASNSMRPKYTYHYRTVYDQEVFRDEYKPHVVDLWYEKPYYGRIDHRSDFVQLYENRLSFFNEPVDQRAIDFVVDAFNDMRGYYSNGILSGKLTKNSVFANLKVYRGYEDSNVAYLRYIKRVYTKYFGSVVNTMANVEIRTFDSFLRNFIQNFEISNRQPINLISFLATPRCSVNSSGLAIDLLEANKSNDVVKDLNIHDPNYKFLVVTARKFGFYIDKNAPTRIIANPRSTRMQKYMDKYNLSDYKDFFEKYTSKTYKRDYDNFKSIMKQFYRSHLNVNPTVVRSKPCGNRVDGFESVVYRLRKQDDLQIPERQMFFYYLETRLRETGLSRHAALAKLDVLKRKYKNYQIDDMIEVSNVEVFNRYPDYIIKERPTKISAGRPTAGASSTENGGYGGGGSGGY